VLPGETYVKGFLRTYAEYLGLDGQLYVDEYNSRFAREEEFPVQSPAARRPRPRRMESNFVVVALAGIVAVTILVVVAWKFGSSGETADPVTGRGLAGTSTSSDTTGETSSGPKEARRPKLARFVLTAARGDCWVRVRARSAAGELLYQGTLEQGQTQRFAKWKKLFVELGQAASLDAKLNGTPVRNLPDNPSIVVVTADGVRVVTTT
jgi:hypothetical protein